jgi:AcrR family transcriptional regulator
MKKDARRQQIMRKAEALFSSKRFHEITLDEVALAARVGKGTIYRYFENKEDLYTQTVVAGLDELRDLLERTVPWKASFRDRLLVLCREIGDFYENRRSLFRMMQAEEIRLAGSRGRQHSTWVENRGNILAIVEKILREGVNEGMIRGDIAPAVLGSFLLGMLRTRVRNLESIPEELRGYEVLVDLFLLGASGSDKRVHHRGELRNDG